MIEQIILKKIFVYHLLLFVLLFLDALFLQIINNFFNNS